LFVDPLPSDQPGFDFLGRKSPNTYDTSRHDQKQHEYTMTTKGRTMKSKKKKGWGSMDENKK
jgi:hypothetical protein